MQNEQAIEQQKLNDLKSTFTARTNEIRNLESLIQQKNKQILYLDEEILVQEFGLYKPQYDFASALDYKEALTSIRATQKELIKNKEAVTGDTQWEVNGNKAKGKKMVTDTQKLLLRAFNVECDELISKVRYTNFDASLNKINKSAEAISKLGTIMNISITQQYLNAKKKENIYKIAIASVELAKQKKGALIVIEREIRIQDIISTGIIMNSEISPQLLVNIFEPNTPLHDGAVVISDNKIAAACCMLPLADDKDIARELGTRHRAAIGASEVSDAYVIVVSEETGAISMAQGGTLYRDVTTDSLRKMLSGSTKSTKRKLVLWKGRQTK